MPELPEVEDAAERLRAAVIGARIARVRVHHPALRARLPAAAQRRMAGARITGVERRGKHLLIALEGGRVLLAHFRMSGDWDIAAPGEGAPPYTRAALHLEDGRTLALTDPRALATLQLAAADALPLPELGPDPLSRRFTARSLRESLARRPGPIKPVLLDQRIVAGLGNIYAAEALWAARIDPRTPASALASDAVADLVRAIRAVLRRAVRASHRYRTAGAVSDTAPRFAVYDREGEPCRRCRTPISRLPQAGRSTYWCPGCQRP